MTERNEKDVTPSTETGQPKAISRRALLRGGVTVMPAILTLQSGAALARSSNLIGAAPRETVDRLGRTLCLDTTSVLPPTGDSVKYDLDEPPYARVNIIPDREHMTDRNYGSRSMAVSEGYMCEHGGVYWYHDDAGWHSVELPYNGVVVSATAFTSMADGIIDTLV